MKVGEYITASFKGIRRLPESYVLQAQRLVVFLAGVLFGLVPLLGYVSAVQIIDTAAVFICALCALCALVLFSKKQRAGIKLFAATSAALLVGLIAFAFFHSQGLKSWLGFGFSLGSVGSVLAIICAYVVGYYLAKRHREFSTTILSAVFATGVIQLLIHAFSESTPMLPLTYTLVFPLGALVAIGILLSGSARNFFESTVTWSALLVSILYIATTAPVPFVLFFVLISAILIVRILQQKSKANNFRERMRVLFIGILVLLPLCVVSIYNPVESRFITNFFGEPQQEIRPSFEATFMTLVSVVKEKPEAILFGTGPLTFSYIWDIHMSDIIGNSLLWNKDFDSGYSTVLTLVIEFGLLIVPAALFLLAFFIQSLVRANDVHAVTFSCAVLFVVGILFVYPLSLFTIVLAAISGGHVAGRLDTKEQSSFLPEKSNARLFVLVAATIIVIVIVASVSHAVSILGYNQAQKILQFDEGLVDYDRAVALLERTPRLGRFAEQQRLLSFAYRTRATSHLENGGAMQDVAPDSVQAHNAADAARTYSKNDYRTSLMLAEAMLLRGFAQENESFKQQALVMFSNAYNQAPSRPITLISLIRAANVLGLPEEERKYLQQIKDRYPGNTEVAALLQEAIGN